APLPGASIFEAVGLLKLGADTAATAGDQDLMALIHFELGGALRLAARNKDAIAEYEWVAKSNCDPLLKVRALEEQAQVYRLMQNLGAAEEALDRANAVRFEHNVLPTGIATYYTANILRDANQFKRADALYQRAEVELGEAGDEYWLCCLYGDISWMKYLSGEKTTAEVLSERAKQIAQ